VGADSSIVDEARDADILPTRRRVVMWAYSEYLAAESLGRLGTIGFRGPLSDLNRRGTPNDLVDVPVVLICEHNFDRGDITPVEFFSLVGPLPGYETVR
jgi:hypothetical protein